MLESSLKKTKVELELLKETDILLIIEKGIRVGICPVIHRYRRANDKYMNDYDPSKELK